MNREIKARGISVNEQENEAAVAPEKDDGLLYHYTTQAGLLGILKEEAIWATHIRYLNDATEFTKGIDTYRAIIKEIKVDPFSMDLGKYRAANAEVFEPVLHSLLPFLLFAVDSTDAYVISFFDSAKSDFEDAGDVLAQWRAYSGSTAGLSLGFERRELCEQFEINDYPKSLLTYGPCTYREAEYEDLFKQSIQTSIPFFIQSIIASFDRAAAFVQSGGFDELQKQKMELTEQELQERLIAISKEQAGIDNLVAEGDKESLEKIIMSFLAPLAFIKHGAFRDEKEWRMVRLLTDREDRKLKFRAGLSSLIPYIPCSLKFRERDSPLLRRVVVGPTPKMNEAVNAVELLFRSFGIKLWTPENPTGLKVVPSKIPYRTW